MRDDLDHLREQAQRARWWAVSTSDPIDRERIEAVARDYEEMARRAEGGGPANQAD
jgi:TPP-dependent trihydroxycyclohexane-1,2-dione (THcHDO) dehydratase